MNIQGTLSGHDEVTIKSNHWSTDPVYDQTVNNEMYVTRWIALGLLRSTGGASVSTLIKASFLTLPVLRIQQIELHNSFDFS